MILSNFPWKWLSLLSTCSEVATCWFQAALLLGGLYNCLSLLLVIAVINNITNPTWGGKGLFLASSFIIELNWGRYSRKEAGAGTDAEAMVK